MIEIAGVNKRYRVVQALSEVSFAIPDGTVTGFVGPNGAGKSTLMRVVMGLDLPDSGVVKIDGRPNDPTPHPDAQVSALLDASWAYGRRTAADHLWMLAAAQGLPRRRAHEVLELVGLGGVAKNRVGTFSLGMRQRLGIAAALLGNPRSVLLDEPANGLDPEGVRWMRGLVRGLAENGAAVLVSSHLLSELSQTADRIVMIARGRVQVEGSLAELLAEPTDNTLVGADDLPRLQAACRAAGAVVRPREAGRLIVCGLRPAEVSRLACAAGVLLTHLEADAVTLEDRFVALTYGQVDYRAGLPAQARPSAEDS